MKPKVISFHYVLTNNRGEKLDSSEGGPPFSFLADAGQIIPGLDRELQTLPVGEKRRINVKAADAYGPRDEQLVIKVPRARIPAAEIRIGDRFRTSRDARAAVVTVTALSDTEVTLDGNHPLAGEDLTFDVEVTAVREATAEEIAHGHAHGPGAAHTHES